MTRGRSAAVTALAVIVFLVFSYGTGYMLLPERDDYGCTWDTFLSEDRNSIDVIVSGSSLAYCDVIPAVIWEKTGITSYVMAGPEQTIPISYYYLREACRTQRPTALFLEATGMFYKQYQDYTKVNIGYMPWGLNRLRATFEAAESSELPGLLFPLYDYHSRFFTAAPSEIKARLLRDSPDRLAGYTLLNKAQDPGKTIYRKFAADDENYRRNLSYIKSLAKFCAGRDIDLYLYIAPTRKLIPEDMLQRLKQDAANIDGINFIDFSDPKFDFGFDDSADWYDSLHLNVSGAEKFSSFLAGYMSDDLGITAGGKGDVRLWQSRADYIARQEIGK